MIGFLSFLAVGFFLGMRHAKDPDHVAAAEGPRDPRDSAQSLRERVAFTLMNEKELDARAIR